MLYVCRYMVKSTFIITSLKVMNRHRYDFEYMNISIILYIISNFRYKIWVLHMYDNIKYNV